MNKYDRQTSWNTRYQSKDGSQPEACFVLREYAWLLPTEGTSLDLACGRGGNALFLAAHGLTSHAWDYAENALLQIAQSAEENHLAVHTEIRDVVANPPAPSSFDVITVSRFLERNLIPHLIKALRPSGLMFYQTFTRIRVDDSGPKSPGFRLADNELLSLFQELRVLAYQEVGAVGSTAQGLRNEAILVGQKR